MITPVITDYGWQAVVNGRLIEAATEQELFEYFETPEEARRRKAEETFAKELERAWREFDLR